MNNLEFLKETNIHKHTIKFSHHFIQWGSGDCFTRHPQYSCETTAYINDMELGMVFRGKEEDLNRFCQADSNHFSITEEALENLYSLAQKQKAIKSQQQKMKKNIHEFVKNIQTQKLDSKAVIQQLESPSKKSKWTQFFMPREQKEAHLFIQSLDIQGQEDVQRYKNIAQIYDRTKLMHPSYATSAFEDFVEKEIPSEDLNKKIVALATPIIREIVQLNKNPQSHKQRGAEITSKLPTTPKHKR